MSDQAFFIQQNISDFDQFCESAQNWDLEFRLIKAGNFSSQLLMFGDSKLIFSRSKIENRIVQNGATPTGLITFGMLANPNTEIFWRDAPVDGSCVFIFPPGGELFAITQADFDVFAVSMTESTLDRCCALLELPDFRTLVDQNEIFRFNPKILFNLRHLLFDIDSVLTSQNNELKNKQFLRHIQHELAMQFVLALSSHDKVVYNRALRKRDISLKAAVNFIHRASGPVPSIPEVCDSAHASQRMLQYAFKERYQMTPKAYMVMERLNRTHKQLKSARYGRHQVSDIARKNGFWHMGKFSADYKKLFSESPSATLERRTK